MAGDLFSAVTGGIVALVAKESLSWLMRAAIQRSDLSRDGLVDIATTVKSVEETVRQIERARQPASYEDLVEYPSRWIQGRPILPATTYVTGFGDEAAHIHAILMFDALDWFDRRAVQHKEAFSWLIDKCDPNGAQAPSWNGAACRERLGVLRDARRLMKVHARDAARHGYYSIEAIWSVALILPPAWRKEYTAIEKAKEILQLESREDAGRKARELYRILNADGP